MRKLLQIPLAGLLLAAGAFAQGQVVPPKLTAFAKDAIFNSPNVPGTTFSQIHIIPYPGQMGKYIVAITVNSGLPQSWGGVGGSDLLTGVYDVKTNKFTPDKNAAFLNGSKAEFGLTLYHNGLIAFFESSSAGTYSPYLATRTSLNQPFKVAGQIANMPKQSYWDGSLANLGGKIHVLHVLGNDIAASPLDVGKVSVGNPTILVRTPVSNTTANSPTPIVDSTGELIAITHHVTQNANDHWLSFDLDPNTPALQFITMSDWINNGGYIAGTFYDAHAASTGYRIDSVQTVWWTGGKAKIGSNMEIYGYAPVRGLTAVPWVSFFLLSNKFASPLTVPGVIGKFGLNPMFLMPFTLGTHNPLTGAAKRVIPIPNNPVLSGHAIPGQSLTLDPKTQKLMLGNTAVLTIL